MMYQRVLVTGGAGFIGSHLVRELVHQGVHVLCYDKLTYAGCRFSLDDVEASGKLTWTIADLRDAESLRGAFDNFQPQAVIHLAAESHVDRSINSPQSCVDSNVCSVTSLANQCLVYRDTLSARASDEFRVVAISTDEVFGSIDPLDQRRFTEASPYAPNSPYSASKAAGDLILRAYRQTYGLSVATVYSSNNYGPYQHPEKFLPNSILSVLKGQKVPVYGNGQNIRDWVHVSDHVDAILKVLNASSSQFDDYAIGGTPLSNLQMLHLLLSELTQNHTATLNSPDKAFDDLANEPKEILEIPSAGDTFPKHLMFVPDRLGHDFKYEVDSAKIRKSLGWRPKVTLRQGLCQLVNWYQDNSAWVQRVLARTASEEH